jgi:hypothetical protein
MKLEKMSIFKKMMSIKWCQSNVIILLKTIFLI